MSAEHHEKDDKDTLSMEAGRGGLKLTVPKYWSKWVGPVIPWAIMVITVAVAFTLIMWGLSFILGDSHAVFSDDRRYGHVAQLLDCSTGMRLRVDRRLPLA